MTAKDPMIGCTLIGREGMRGEIVRRSSGKGTRLYVKWPDGLTTSVHASTIVRLKRGEEVISVKDTERFRTFLKAFGLLGTEGEA